MIKHFLFSKDNINFISVSFLVGSLYGVPIPALATDNKGVDSLSSLTHRKRIQPINLIDNTNVHFNIPLVDEEEVEIRRLKEISSIHPDPNILFKRGRKYRKEYEEDYCARWFGGWEKNYALSAYYYARAALAGHVDAKRELEYIWNEYDCFWGFYITRVFPNLPKTFNQDVLIEHNSYVPIIERANLEYKEIQYKLGEMYANVSGGVQKNDREAEKWTRLAANQGHPKAQYILGMMYNQGKGVDRDNTKAISWLRKAAQQKAGRLTKQEFMLAEYTLGCKFYNGAEGIEKNNEEALIWFRKSADRGYVPAQYILDLINTNGTEQESARAEYTLGCKFYNGAEGIEKNNEEALIWFHKSADRGYAPAQHFLGIIYVMKTGGVQKNDREAERWTRLAANQGHLRARYNLGVMYFHGIGVTRDNAKAIAWISRVIQQGADKLTKQELARAECTLGLIYLTGGFGIEQNDTETLKWLHKSARREYAEAEFILGEIYLDRNDTTTASVNYRKARSHGHEKATFVMNMYEIPKGELKKYWPNVRFCAELVKMY